MWGGGLRVCRGKGAIEGSGEAILSGRGLGNLLSTARCGGCEHGTATLTEAYRGRGWLLTYFVSNQPEVCVLCSAGRPTAHSQIVKIGRGNFVREGA